MADEASPQTPAKPPTGSAAASPTAPATPAPTPSVTTTSAAVAVAGTAVAEPAATEVPKVKPKKATQRACDEKDAKGKLCCGHLKRWYDYPKEIEALVGAKMEVYRCEFCKTLYTPDRSQPPHSYTLRY